jgi:long-chain fatty acid transport protein
MPGMRFGIGLQSAFGLKTEYDNGWAGRYHALKSELKTVNLNPTLAYAVNDQWSIGLGVSAQYAKVELSRAIDFGSVCAGSLGVARCAPSGFLPQARDGKVTLDGDDWAFGFNLGALYMPTPAMRFGLSYRSSIQHKLSGGSARFDKPAGLPGPLAAASAFADSGVSATLDLPETVNLSAYVELDSKWALLGDLHWTRWSRFEELRVKFDNGSPDSVVKEAWRNTVRVGAGVNYRYNDAWLLRGGLSYEPSPVKDAFRTPSIPDASRKILAFGLQFKPTKQSAWDVGYAHVFIKDAPISRTDVPLNGNLVGTYKSDVNILIVQYSHVF